jgi:putative spermidine/putrescine transport system permease protein
MKWIGYLAFALLLTPLVLTILTSFTPSRYLELPHGEWNLNWYRQFFADLVWVQALGNSLVIAAVTAVLSVITALMTAIALVRLHFRRRFRWAGVWEGALLLPVVLPGVALVIGMLAIVRLTPLWGTQLSLALAHSVLAMPVAYMVIRASLKQVDPNLEAAARGLGAGPWQVFQFVTLPLIVPAVLAATLFALVISLNEITLSLFLATRYTETLPRVIWPNLRFSITPLAAAASVILLAVTLPALVAAGWSLRPRRGDR